MFGLFKKKKLNIGITDPGLADFRNSLSENQKAAIIYSLMMMIASDGTNDVVKTDYVGEQAKLIKIDLDGESMLAYEVKKWDYAYSYIKTLTESQKEWYSVALANIMLVNKRPPTEKELVLAERILEGCNISFEFYKNSNIKANAILKRMNS